VEYVIIWTFGGQGYYRPLAFPTFKDVSGIIMEHAEAGNLDKLLKLQVRNNSGKLVDVVERDKTGELVYNWINMPN